MYVHCMYVYFYTTYNTLVRNVGNAIASLMQKFNCVSVVFKFITEAQVTSKIPLITGPTNRTLFEYTNTLSLYIYFSFFFELYFVRSVFRFSFRFAVCFTCNDPNNNFIVFFFFISDEEKICFNFSSVR